MSGVAKGNRFIGIRGDGQTARGLGTNTGARKFVQAKTPKVRLPNLKNLFGGGKGMISPK